MQIKITCETQAGRPRYASAVSGLLKRRIGAKALQGLLILSFNFA